LLTAALLLKLLQRRLRFYLLLLHCQPIPQIKLLQLAHQAFHLPASLQSQPHQIFIYMKVAFIGQHIISLLLAEQFQALQYLSLLIPRFPEDIMERFIC
jgi:hypothetical protein